jgi:hypothetical protein
MNIKKITIIFFLIFQGNNICLAQEKPLWEALKCDTTEIVLNRMTARSLVLNFLKENHNSIPTAQKLIFIENSVQENKTDRMTIYLDEKGEKIVNNSFLDSISSFYLGFLLSNKMEIYNKWKNWIDPHRTIFIEKRDSLIDEFHKAHPKLKIRILSDLRTQGDQKEILKKGYSTANLSFHQLGLASDMGIFQKNRYLKDSKYYNLLGELAKKYQLYWGGNFVGFVDISHLQYYYNSAALIRINPYLSIEFEMFYEKYLERIRSKIGVGKEFEVEDSKELMVELNQLRKKEPCFCEVKDFNFENISQLNFKTHEFDHWIIYNEKESHVFVKYPYKSWKMYKLGNWK